MIKNCNHFYQDNINHAIYIYSNDLKDIEIGMKDTIKGVIFSKKIICIALAQIKLKELYKQAHVSSFKDYLKAGRIPIKYSTAIDYSLIGEALLKYRALLENHDFKEEDGLKKLLLLDKALTKYKNKSEIVFQKIKGTSFRDFKRFVNKDINDSLNTRKKTILSYTDLSIKADDECIYIEETGKEILWFNIDMEKDLGIDFILTKKIRTSVLNTIKILLKNCYYSTSRRK